MFIVTVEATPALAIVLIASWIITCLVMFIKDRIENYRYKKHVKEWEKRKQEKKNAEALNH